MTAHRRLIRTGGIAALLACATACGSPAGRPASAAPGTASPIGARSSAATLPACDLLSEATAKNILGLTIGLIQQAGTDSCKYLTPGTLYQEVDWAQLKTSYRSAGDAVTAAQALFTSTAWTPAESPTGLGPGARLLAGHSNGHDSDGTAVQVDEFIIVWASPSGTFQALLTSELTEDASKDRSVSAAQEVNQAETGSSAGTAAPNDTTASSASPSANSDSPVSGTSQWALTGSCPSSDTISSALGVSVQTVTPQDGVACQYHASGQDIGLDLYTADSLSDERLTLDAAHGGIQDLNSLGPNVQQAYGNGNFFNICSVSAPWGDGGGGVVAEAKDASMQPLDGKALCPAALALFTAGARNS